MVDITTTEKEQLEYLAEHGEHADWLAKALLSLSDDWIRKHQSITMLILADWHGDRRTYTPTAADSHSGTACSSGWCHLTITTKLFGRLPTPK